jgi:hypothetical protein
MVNNPTPTRRQRDGRFQQKAIGGALRRLYENVVAEAPPEGFLQLLAQADLKLSR